MCLNLWPKHLDCRTMRNEHCNSCGHRRESRPRWWECLVWNTRRPTRGWWAWLRLRQRISANFFRAAKGHEKKELAQGAQKTQSSPTKTMNFNDGGEEPRRSTRC